MKNKAEQLIDSVVNEIKEPDDGRWALGELEVRVVVKRIKEDQYVAHTSSSVFPKGARGRSGWEALSALADMWKRAGFLD